jgi:DNA-binding winged helix-turn-helix (wHTH) protein
MRVVGVYVGYLRRKLGETAIETVRGTGYRLRADALSASGRRISCLDLPTQ